jgi:hypothetical protein
MGLLEVLALTSSLSFFAYGIAYFTSANMKSEFARFGLSRFGTLTAVLEILGAFGLLVGLQVNHFLLISSAGLALLMFLGVAVRVKAKDVFWALLPALLFAGLNSCIFVLSMNIQVG